MDDMDVQQSSESESDNDSDLESSDEMNMKRYENYESEEDGQIAEEYDEYDFVNIRDEVDQGEFEEEEDESSGEEHYWTDNENSEEDGSQKVEYWTDNEEEKCEEHEHRKANFSTETKTEKMKCEDDIPDEEIYEWTGGVEGTDLKATTDLLYADFVEKHIKYTEYPTQSAQEDPPEEIMHISEIRLPPWTINVSEIGAEDMYHAIEIPRNEPSPYFPLLSHVKAVSAETATTLLRQIAGLSSVALKQTMKAREASMLIQREGEMLLKSAQEEIALLRAELGSAQHKMHELLRMVKPNIANTITTDLPNKIKGPSFIGTTSSGSRHSNQECGLDDVIGIHRSLPNSCADPFPFHVNSSNLPAKSDWNLSAPCNWVPKPKKDEFVPKRQKKL